MDMYKLGVHQFLTIANFSNAGMQNTGAPEAIFYEAIYLNCTVFAAINKGLFMVHKHAT